MQVELIRFRKQCRVHTIVLLRYADKRSVDIIKVHTERNNLQLK